jgi:hypothetical protein
MSAGTGKRLRALMSGGILLLASLMLCEIGLQIGASIWPELAQITTAPWDRPKPNRFIVDPRNGVQGDPDYPEHDAWGFRNTHRPEHANIVTLGDSWTYGTTVSAESVWPALLSEQLPQTLYNAGMGGNNPVNYLQNFYRILTLDPDMVLVAIYLGNDVVATNKMVVMDKADQVAGGFSSADLSRLADELAIDLPQEERPLWEDCGIDMKPQQQQSRPQQQQHSSANFRSWISTHSQLYGLFRAVRLQLNRTDANELLPRQFDSAKRKIKPENYRHCAPFDDGDWKTIFQNSWRRKTMDTSSLRVEMGQQIALNVIDVIATETDKRGIRLGVLIFPTKENVFYEHARNQDGLSDVIWQELQLINRSEEEIRNRLLDHLQQQGIEHLDLRHALQQSEQQTFFASWDSHPNELGNQLIANAIHKQFFESAGVSLAR